MLSFFGIKGPDARPPAGAGSPPQAPPEPPGPTTFSEALPGGSGGSNSGGTGDGKAKGGRGKGSVDQAFHFDPSGLERAAKAARLVTDRDLGSQRGRRANPRTPQRLPPPRRACDTRDLDTSRNARDAFELVKTQERTEQMRLEAQTKEYEARSRALELERIQREGEERRKTLETETAHMQYRNQEQDKLARKRQEEQIAAQRAMQEEQLRRQEESLKRQEDMKRATVDYEMRLKREIEIDKVKAETEGKIRYERENRDVHLEELRVKAAEARETALETIRVAGTSTGPRSAAR